LPAVCGSDVRNVYKNQTKPSVQATNPFHTHKFPIALPTHLNLIHLTPYIIKTPYTTQINFSAVSMVVVVCGCGDINEKFYIS
jgi:hypothetical protein